jgi:hypothetical protein
MPRGWRLAYRRAHDEIGLDERGPRSDDLAVDEIDPIDPREAERMRRRDHEAEAESRNLMRPGMGKVFKQIQDSWAKSAKKPPKPRRQPRP